MGHKLYSVAQRSLRASIFCRSSNNIIQFAPSALDATCGCATDEERYESRRTMCVGMPMIRI